MVQEVKIQSSNFAAEYGSGGMNVSAITKGGSSKFSGTVYDYNRNHKFAANDRSNSITGTAKPKSTFNYPGGNIGGPIIIPGIEFNNTRDKAFFFVGVEVQRQKVDTGSFLSTTLTDKMKAGDLSELLPGNCVGQNLNMTCAQFNIPRGFPGAGTPAPGNNFAALHRTRWARCCRTCIRRRTTTTRTTATTTSSTRCSRPTAPT